MRTFLLSLALLASSCAGTCSAVGGGSIGYGAIGSGSIGNGAIGGQQATADTCDPFGSPDLAFMGCNVDGSNNTTLANNDPVCTWHDSGSLGVDATQGTGTACPTFVAGGGPNGTQDAVTFDGGDWLSTGAAAFAALATPNTVASVASVTGIDVDGSAIVDGATSTERVFVGMTGSGASNRWAIIADSLGGSSVTPTAGQWESLVASFDSTSALSVSGTVRVSGSLGTTDPDGVSIGARYDGTSTFHVGSIATALVYDTPVVVADLDAYLADHHASTFPVAP